MSYYKHHIDASKFATKYNEVVFFDRSKKMYYTLPRTNLMLEGDKFKKM